MKLHHKISGIAFVFLTLFSAFSHAAITTYTNRTAFQNALATFSVDNLNGVTPYLHYGDVRGGYTISSPSTMYGCINQAGCGDNSGLGFDNAYLWNYVGIDTFSFQTAVSGFGFDYANPACCYPDAHAVLEGLTSPGTAGFFGVISDIALTSFSVNQTGSYMLMDNITYGTAGSSSVPEPASLALIGLALAGLGASRRGQLKGPGSN